MMLCTFFLFCLDFSIILVSAMAVIALVTVVAVVGRTYCLLLVDVHVQVAEEEVFAKFKWLEADLYLLLADLFLASVFALLYSFIVAASFSHKGSYCIFVGII